MQCLIHLEVELDTSLELQHQLDDDHCECLKEIHPFQHIAQNVLHEGALVVLLAEVHEAHVDGVDALRLSLLVAETVGVEDWQDQVAVVRVVSSMSCSHVHVPDKQKKS